MKRKTRLAVVKVALALLGSLVLTVGQVLVNLSRALVHLKFEFQQMELKESNLGRKMEVPIPVLSQEFPQP